MWGIWGRGDYVRGNTLECCGREDLRGSARSTESLYGLQLMSFVVIKKEYRNSELEYCRTVVIGFYCSSDCADVVIKW